MKATKLPSDSCLVRPWAAGKKGPGRRLRLARGRLAADAPAMA